MLSVLYSLKGGQGTSVTAAMLSMASAKQSPTVLVDLDGDQPAIFGVNGNGKGLAEWSRGKIGGDLVSLTEPLMGDDLVLLPRGYGSFSTGILNGFADCLKEFGGNVIVDAGSHKPEVVLGTVVGQLASHLLAEADQSVLVTRNCYLSLKLTALAGAGLREFACPDEMILVEELCRPLTKSDCERAVNTPASVVLPYDPDVSRSVDAGMTRTRIPRRHINSLAKVVKQTVGASR